MLRHASFVALAVLAAACTMPTDPELEDLGQSAQALDTYPNEQPAFDYFVAKGLTPAQSAGIVGNLDVESGVDPTIVQKGGPGRGIAQWSVGGRWDTAKNDNVLAYASQQGQSATSLQLQLAFIWYELTTFPAYGLAKLQAAPDIATSVGVFAQYYEGCGSCSTSLRIQHAQSVLDRFGADAPDGSASSSSGGPTGPSCTIADGTAGVCITTDECAALGTHTSSPGFCPGAANVQCCTPGGGSSSGASSGGSSSSSGGGTSSGESSSNHAAGTDDGTGCTIARAPARSAWPAALAAALALSFVRRRRANVR